MSEDEGTYVPGKGYVPRKKKVINPQSYNTRERSPMVVTAGTNPIQDIIGRVFRTVPRNKLKEAGLED
jgi:hypothetical protein